MVSSHFTDESSIQILQGKTTFMRRKPNEKLIDDCVKKCVKHPLSIMIWSVINYKGTGRLYIVDGTMRQQQYLSVLETRFLPQVKEWFPNSEFILMHDSAPCHEAKSVSEWLKKSKIHVLDWPGNSPDMNPVENVWEALKKEISKDHIITNKKNLIEQLIKAWNSVTEIQQIVKNCIHSMPRGVPALIKVKGGFKKYSNFFLFFLFLIVFCFKIVFT